MEGDRPARGDLVGRDLLTAQGPAGQLPAAPFSLDGLALGVERCGPTDALGLVDRDREGLGMSARGVPRASAIAKTWAKSKARHPAPWRGLSRTGRRTVVVPGVAADSTSISRALSSSSTA